MEMEIKWQKEYEQKGIPSSYKIEPSQTISEFNLFLKQHNVAPGRLLDLGCGKGGRNAFFWLNKDMKSTVSTSFLQIYVSLKKKLKRDACPLSLIANRPAPPSLLKKKLLMLPSIFFATSIKWMNGCIFSIDVNSTGY